MHVMTDKTGVALMHFSIRKNTHSLSVTMTMLIGYRNHQFNRPKDGYQIKNSNCGAEKKNSFLKIKKCDFFQIIFRYDE